MQMKGTTEVPFQVCLIDKKIPSFKGENESSFQQREKLNHSRVTEMSKSQSLKEHTGRRVLDGLN